MRLELETVGCLVTAYITLERITETVATGVDGEHDMIQEDDLAMHAVERLQLLDVSLCL